MNSKKKPTLEYEAADDGSFLVRLSDEDTQHVQKFYRWLALRGLNISEKKDEFAAMARVQIPYWLLDRLEEDFKLIPLEEGVE